MDEIISQLNVTLPRRRQLRLMITRLRRLFALRRHKRRWVMVIINPAAGQASPDLKAFNRIIHAAGFDWEVEVTNSFGDGGRLATWAVSNGASLVAACGGDGTILDVASGLIGSKVPLAILPTGTGNVLAKDLGIPLEANAACAMMVDANSIQRTIDLGVADQNLFLLRLGVGLEADIVRTADRDLKDRLGMLAYVAATFQALGQAPLSHYHLELDGQPVEMDGLACMVANAGSLGLPLLTLSPQVRIDDGRLDVFIIRRVDLAELAALAASVVGTADTASQLPHWQAREVSIQADPPHGVEVDGETAGVTPVSVNVLHAALRVMVPGRG